MDHGRRKGERVMDFSLTEEQEMVRKTARSFAEKELLPRAAEVDKTEEFPHQTVKKMGELGFFGAYFPVEYGGGGMDFLSYILIVEEIARCDASHATVLAASTSLCGASINIAGTEEQKKKYLTPLATGEKLGAYALTEPNAGSDVSLLQTTAMLDKDEYVLNGSKQFITNGDLADIVVVYASVDKAKKHKGIAVFIVEKGTEGFSVGKLEDKLGVRGTGTAQLSFADCRIPKENILGGEEGLGRGFIIAMQSLDVARVGAGAAAVGIAQASLEASVNYSQERKQFGQPISSFQAISFALSDMAVEIDAARLLVYKAAYLKDKGLRFSKEAAMAKLYASEIACSCADKAIQIHGGYGYIKDYPVERFWRDARIHRIYEGTSEVQRLVIAHSLLR